MTIVFITRPIKGRPNAFRMKAMADSLRIIDSNKLEKYALVIFSKRRNRIQIATFIEECTKMITYSLERGTFHIPIAEESDEIYREISIEELQEMLFYEITNRQHFTLFKEN